MIVADEEDMSVEDKTGVASGEYTKLLWVEGAVIHLQESLVVVFSDSHSFLLTLRRGTDGSAYNKWRMKA